MRNIVIVCAAFAFSACAQSFLKGAKISSRNLATSEEPNFTLGDCREAGTENPAPKEALLTPVNGKRGGSYWLVDFQDAPALFERVSGGSYAITNSWREADGRHFFTWVLATGWEFIIPDSGNGKRLLRRGGSTRAPDGTGRPTNKEPLYECDLIRSGSFAAQTPPPPPPPAMTPGTRVAAATTAAPAPVESKPAVQKGSPVVITLNNGTEVKGTLLSETATGFLVKGASGTRMVKFEDVADIKAPGAAVVTPAPVQPPPAAPTVVQQPAPVVGPRTTRISLFSKDDQSWVVKIGESRCATP